MLLGRFLLIFSLLLITACSNDRNNLKSHACFTPGENCIANIVTAITQAKKSIYIQTDNFFSPEITTALLDAKQRGVNVQAIFDQSQQTEENSSALLLLRHGVSVWIDDKVVAANNRIIIIDDSKTITGSFNFTQNSQDKNAENSLTVEDPAIAKRYLDNWQSRMVLSRVMTETAPAVKVNKISHRTTSVRRHLARARGHQTNNGPWLAKFFHGM